MIAQLGNILATLFAVILVAVLLLAIVLALLFFIAVMSAGWLSILAPDAELATLPLARRRLVKLRAMVALAVFWVLLLSAPTGSGIRGNNPTEGNEAFGRWRGLLRRVSGLPVKAPEQELDPPL